MRDGSFAKWFCIRFLAVTFILQGAALIVMMLEESESEPVVCDEELKVGESPNSHHDIIADDGHTDTGHPPPVPWQRPKLTAAQVDHAIAILSHEQRFADLVDLREEDCMFGYEPFGNLTLKRQLSMVARYLHAQREDDSARVAWFQHTRKAGGGEFRRRILQMGMATKAPRVSRGKESVSYFETQSKSMCADMCLEHLVDGGVPFIAMSMVRHPVERLVSDYSWGGPGGQANEQKRQRWATDFKGLNLSHASSWRKWMEWEHDRCHSFATYVPNHAVTQISTLPLIEGARMQCGRKETSMDRYCQGYIPPRIDPEDERVLLESMLEVAKRVVVSFTLALPIEELNNPIPLLEIAELALGRQSPAHDEDEGPEPDSKTASSTLSDKEAENIKPVHFQSHKIACPVEVQQKILDDNWADVELHEFAKRVYECKKAVYERVWNALTTIPDMGA